jgi:putative transposase
MTHPILKYAAVPRVFLSMGVIVFGPLTSSSKQLEMKKIRYTEKQFTFALK